MLKRIKIKDPSLKWDWLSQFEPQTDCLIVSDIKTKFSIESKLLEDHPFLPGSCVMRANEFYNEVFQTLNLNWTLCSDSFVRELFSEFVKTRKQQWIQNLKNSKDFFDFFNLFFSVLQYQDQNQSRIFSDWLDEKNKIFIWKSWFTLCQDFFSVLKSKKIIHESALKSVLFNQLPLLNNLSFSKKRIFVDLAFSLDLCEKEIFQELSRHREVYILCPEMENNLLFERDRDIYQKIKEESESNSIENLIGDFKKTENQKTSLKTQFFSIKSETQVEEVRKAVVQVHKWIQSGISPKDIAVVSPHIEDYWFALKTYFEKENIEVNKSVFANALHFSDMQYFLSTLRVHSGHFQFFDLEQFSFYRDSRKNFAYFKNNYFYVPDRSSVKKLFYNKRSKSFDQKITGQDFIKWALSFWPKEGSSFLLEKIFRAFKKIPLEETLRLGSWLRFLESELSAMEIELKGENNRGISCLSFNAMFSLRVPYVFILGLDEESFKSSSLNILNESERENILKGLIDLGFPPSLGSLKERENNLLWFLQSSKHKEICLSFANYDFKGEIRAGSLIYLLSPFLFHSKAKKISEYTAFDYNRKQKDMNKILSAGSIEKENAKALQSVFQSRDQAFFQKSEIKLSSSSLSLYDNCPFKYSADKLFFICDAEPVDREVSPLSKGSIVHLLFQKTLQDYPDDLELSSQQREDLIQSVMDTVNEREIVHERQYSLLKDYLERLLKSFLEKERKEREQYPSLKPKAFELNYSAYWDKKKGEPDHQGDYVFTGKIDRIDQDEITKKYVVRDYKASGNSLTHISSWAKNSGASFQLIFYAQVLEKGLIEGYSSHPVSALLYSFYKDFSAKGFVDKDSSLEELISSSSRNHHFKKGRDILLTVIQKSNQHVQFLLNSMEKGKFLPKPKDEAICKKCLYRNWCRVKERI